MAEYATKQEVQEIVDRAIDKAITDLSEVIANFAQQVDGRFNAVEARQQELDQKFDRLLGTIDSFVGRIDRYESEQLARDSQFNRLLDCAQGIWKDWDTTREFIGILHGDEEAIVDYRQWGTRLRQSWFTPVDFVKIPSRSSWTTTEPYYTK